MIPSDKKLHSGLLERLDVDDPHTWAENIDATLQWWAKQDEHIRQEALGDENRISITVIVRS